MNAPPIDLALAPAWARDWLFSQALPLWWEQGANHRDGGFHEALDATGRPVSRVPRLRVQARQVFVYGRAAGLGWDGPWQEAMRHGLRFMQAHYARADGLFRSLPGRDETPLDVYDQAFVLLALAEAWRVDRQGPWRDIALRLLTQLCAQLAHPLLGFEEALPRRLPLRANPHMHLLEALLAWVELDDAALFREQAERLVMLATGHLVDAGTGSLPECFDGDWQPWSQDVSREPGHHFEWWYLLMQADLLLGTQTAGVRSGLLAFAQGHGLDRQRNVTVFAVDAAGTVLDARARLWAQTERLRTALCDWRRRPDTAGQEAAAAWAGLRGFLAESGPGLWHEWMQADGHFTDEPAPASSLYHLMTALGELIAPWAPCQPAAAANTSR